jgi:hypothetical protein
MHCLCRDQVVAVCQRNALIRNVAAVYVTSGMLVTSCLFQVDMHVVIAMLAIGRCGHGCWFARRLEAAVAARLRDNPGCRVAVQRAVWQA